MSASSNVINTENLGIYEVNGWMHHQLYGGAVGTKTGLAICDSSVLNILLDCTVNLSTYRNDPMVNCISGFFTAYGPVVVRIYNSVGGSGTAYMKEGDLSIKRIA